MHKNEKRKDEKVGNEHNRLNSIEDELNYINFNLAVFSLFVALVFSYFVYFSHQITEIKSDIYSKIIEVNAINPPFPWSFLSITGHKEYYYLKRREILFNDFKAIKYKIVKETDKHSLAVYGKEVQVLLTQMAYFFPYKKMLDFKQDGSVSFDPNHFESIDSAENLKTNLPSYTNEKGSDNTYGTAFLKEQMDHIYNSHRRFTFELIDGKDKIIESMILANKLTSDYDKSRCKKYVDSLINYLESHYRLAMPLGLAIKKYDYYRQIANIKIIIAISSLLFINFICGVLIPLFAVNLRRNKKLLAITQLTFVIGIFILFRISLYSIPF